MTSAQKALPNIPPAPPAPPVSFSGDSALSDQIASILGANDLFDVAKFDNVQHINTLFPNEQSLVNADKFLSKLRLRSRQLEKQIREMLREQNDYEYSQPLSSVSSVNRGLEGSQRRELVEIQSHIQTLQDDIKDIQEKAKHAETTVQDITKDIKSLDCAKRNFRTTITVLRRLQMLGSAMDQLRDVVSKRKYIDAAPLLQAVMELSHQFKSYQAVKQIRDSLDQIVAVSAELKRMIFTEFEGSFSQQGSFNGNAVTLHDACLVIDVMDPDVKKQLIDWYLDLELREYRSIFRPNDEVGNLDNIARRFAWLKRLCKTYDEEQASIFPKEWNISEVVCDRFCVYTRDDFSTLFIKSQNIDVKTLIKSLQMTLEFEQGLNRRFTTIQTDGQQASLEVSNNFTGKISTCFEPFMQIYIDAEDKTLSEMVEKFKTSNTISDEDLNTGVFSASTDLFYFYRQTLVSMAKLNTRKPFLDLSKLFRKWLMTFCDTLNAKIPKEEKRAASLDEIKLTALILNTAEYCHNTTSQLEEKIKEKIDADFKKDVDMSKERDTFLVLITTTTQVLVRQVNSCLYGPLQSMSKIPWATLRAVGDQSEYITTVNNILVNNVKTIRKLLTNPKHFKWFCDKFVDSFVPLFVKSIYQCKPISEIGAEQMLLDAHSVKTILLEIPNIGAEEKQTLPSTYVKFVTKGVAKAEFLLKVIMTPLDPPEMIIKNYLILSNESNAEHEVSAKDHPLTQQRINELKEGFMKILELKGVKKNEQQHTIDLLMARILQVSTPTTSLSLSQPVQIPVPPPPPSLMSASGAGLSSLASGLASISLRSSAPGQSNTTTNSNIKNTVTDAGSKINENFKRFAAAMDIKSNWLRKDSPNSGQSGSK